MSFLNNKEHFMPSQIPEGCLPLQNCAVKITTPVNKLMRTFETVIFSAMLMCLTGIFTGCKKTDAKRPDCKIMAASLPSLNALFNFSYNSNGKPARIIAASTISSFEYPTDNTIIFTTLDSGRFQGRKIITVNAAGLATNIRIETNVAGTDFANNSFAYDGEELTKSVSTQSSDTTSTITKFTWFNGNMVTVTTDGTVTENRQYFGDKPRQAGDFFSFLEFTQGFETIRTKNLVKFSSQSSGLNFTYDFGAGGNISSVKAELANGGVFFQDYQYECK
jgi:hypothetical protein